MTFPSSISGHGRSSVHVDNKLHNFRLNMIINVMQPLTPKSVEHGVNYLITERLLQSITDTSIVLTDVVPVAMAHIHPFFTETVRIGHPASVALKTAITERTQRIRELLPGRKTLFDCLANVELTVRRDENILKVGHTEMETENAAVYESYSAIVCLVDQLMAIATKNTSATPEEFFTHLTNELSGPVYLKKIDAITSHFTCLDDFIVTRPADHS